MNTLIHTIFVNEVCWERAVEILSQDIKNAQPGDTKALYVTGQTGPAGNALIATLLYARILANLLLF